MRLQIAATIAVAALIAACADEDEPEAQPSAPVTVLATSASSEAPSATASSANSGATIEVQGVVGAVDTRAGTIAIRATGGSSITTIEVGPEATISRVGGGALTLDQVRASDRISAEGSAGSNAATLVADAITVQQVIPGGPPGANPGG